MENKKQHAFNIFTQRKPFEMTFFFLKNPTCLDFFAESDCDEPTRLQVRERDTVDGHQSNSKLCKRKDGTWFVKCGNIKMELSNIPINNMKVAEKTEEGGKVIGFVTKKWFLKPCSDLKEVYRQS